MNKKIGKEPPNKSSQLNARTLGEIVQVPEAHVEAMGVVLDCTGHYRTNHSYNHVTKIRLIDKSHNPTVKSRPHGVECWVTACVFSSTASSAPTVTQIGDVVLIRNVAFDTYKGQVGCKVPLENANWAVFNGRPNAPKTPVCSSRSYKKLTKEETQKLTELREWALHFFINNSLLSLGWYSSPWPAGQDSSAPCQLKDVDALVKVLGSVSAIISGKKYQKFVFCNAKREYYFAELSEDHVELATETVVKLRSVCLVRANKEIRVDFYNYSAVLVVPEAFYDAVALTRETKFASFPNEKIQQQLLKELHLRRYTKYEISSNTFVYELAGKKHPADLSAVFPILAEFTYEYSGTEVSPASFVKHTHAELSFSTLDALSDAFKAASKRSAPRAAAAEVFRVRARIVKSAHRALAPMVYLHSPSAQKTWLLGSQAGNEHSDLMVIFHNVFYLQDDTLGARTLPCHLFTYDANPSYFFDLWRLLPDMLNVAHWRRLDQSAKARFAETLAGLVEAKAEGQFVLELQTSADGKRFYRIIDTILAMRA